MNFTKQDQKQASKEACQVLVHGLPEEAVKRGKIAPSSAKELVEKNSMARLFRARSWIVLLFGLCSSFFVARVVYHAEKNAMNLRFADASAKVASAIDGRMEVYKQVLKGCRGLFEASEEVNVAEWKTYFEALDIEESYPGFLSIGYVADIAPGNEAAMEQRALELGHREFGVWPEPFEGINRRASVLFVEPANETNAGAVGFDPYTKESRHEALERSRLSGKSAVSEKLVLIQDTENFETGFFVVLPIYRKGADLATAESRAQSLEGWVGSGFRVREFLNGLSQSLGQGVAIRLYDGLADSPENLMYTDYRFPREPLFTKIETLIMGGRHWSIEVASLPQFEEAFRPVLSYVVFGAGILSTCLLAGMFSVSRRTEQMAVSIADELTENIRSREVEILRLNRSLEKKVQERTRELQRTNMELEDYTYTITHDLRAPLRTIKGFAEILHDEYGERMDEEGQQLLGRIETSAVAMGDMITDTLSLAKMSNGEVDLEEINLSAVANSIFVMLQSGERDHPVSVNVKRNMKVEADRKVIEIVLRNLIENAWKFTRNEEEPAIEVGEMLKDEIRTFFVRDNGTGFDESNAEEIFRPFRRLHLVEEFEGTGMGMAIARRMIQKHRGRIWAESRPGEGATFFFTINEY